MPTKRPAAGKPARPSATKKAPAKKSAPRKAPARKPAAAVVTPASAAPAVAAPAPVAAPAAIPDPGWLPALEVLYARARAFAEGRAHEAPRLGVDDVPGPVRELQEALPLDDIDLSILMIAAAPALEVAFEEVFAALNREPDAVGPTVDTVMQLAGLDPLDGADRSRFADTSIMRVLNLIETGPTTRGLLRQVVKVPEQVVRYLLDDWRPEPTTVRALRVPERDPLPWELLPEVEIPDALPAVLRARAGTAALDHVRLETFAALDREPMIFDASILDLGKDAHETTLRVCARDASMLGTVLVFDYRTTSPDVSVVDALSFFTHIGAPFIAIVDTRRHLGPWEKAAVTIPLPTLAQREGWWQTLAPGSDLELASTATHLEPEDILQAGATPQQRVLARASGSVRRSRVQTIAPEVSLQDVIVGDRIREQLTALADRVRYRTVVIDEWRMRPGGGRGRGVTALFAGASGTGKSMSAEALAGELGVPLFKVDLASVVDKYIGETEKNLEEVFRSVENDDGVLLFDEADALFGKRSDVSDARDRYANIEVAYLLQRIEQFDGLAILTTNLRANLDEAFQRRLDAIVDFEEPDADARLTIWAKALGPFEGTVAKADLKKLAGLDITGGSIRSAVVSAAYYAAADHASMTREHLLRGLQEEWRKAGRLNFPIGDFDGWRPS